MYFSFSVTQTGNPGLLLFITASNRLSGCITKAAQSKVWQWNKQTKATIKQTNKNSISGCENNVWQWTVTPIQRQICWQSQSQALCLPRPVDNHCFFFSLRLLLQYLSPQGSIQYFFPQSSPGTGDAQQSPSLEWRQPGELDLVNLVNLVNLLGIINLVNFVNFVGIIDLIRNLKVNLIWVFVELTSLISTVSTSLTSTRKTFK